MTIEWGLPETAAKADAEASRSGLLPGAVVMDHEVLREVGAGGMGSVYQVRNRISGRVEAMKVLRADLTSLPESCNRFLHEIKINASLDHPNIASVRTAFRWTDDRIVMMMEFVEGMSLEKRMTSSRLPVAEAIACVSQILGALSYAHGRGVIHRDIKPANIICEPSGRAKLLDFGLALVPENRGMTGAGRILGSIHYMSPEQINGSPVDLRTDIYSMGITLYELVTGTKPFNGPSDYAIMTAHLNRQPRPPVSLVAGVPWNLSEIILTAMSKNPADRFQSARAFQTALASVT